MSFLLQEFCLGARVAENRKMLQKTDLISNFVSDQGVDGIQDVDGRAPRCGRDDHRTRAIFNKKGAADKF